MRNPFSSSVIGLMLLATTVVPSLVMGVFETSSMAAGTLIISALSLLLFVMFKGHFFASKRLCVGAFAIIFSAAVVFAHSAFSYLGSDDFDFERFWQSYLLLIIYIAGAFSFAELMRKLTGYQVDVAVKFVFYSLLLSGLAGIFKYSPFFKEITAKSVFFYIEPSHFALSFLPFLLYMVVRSESRTKFLLIFTSLLMAFLLENLTLLVGIALISFVAVPFRRLALILPFAALLLGAFDIDYYLSRLDFSADNTNLSALVFIQGWERSYLNFLESSGRGVGFQQFGIVGNLGAILENIEVLAGAMLNIFDGGSVAPKFIGEFGLLGLLIILSYVVYCVKGIKKLHKLSVNMATPDDCKSIFFSSCFVMYSIDLFVRGTGYFSSSGFLFIASLMWIALTKSSNYFRFNMPVATWSGP